VFQFTMTMSRDGGTASVAVHCHRLHVPVNDLIGIEERDTDRPLDEALPCAARSNAVVACYHGQRLITVKRLAFGNAVQATLDLLSVRCLSTAARRAILPVASPIPVR
jgi:hypothetical protein